MRPHDLQGETRHQPQCVTPAPIKLSKSQPAKEKTQNESPKHQVGSCTSLVTCSFPAGTHVDAAWSGAKIAQDYAQSIETRLDSISSDDEMDAASQPGDANSSCNATANDEGAMPHRCTSSLIDVCVALWKNPKIKITALLVLLVLAVIVKESSLQGLGRVLLGWQGFASSSYHAPIDEGRRVAAAGMEGYTGRGGSLTVRKRGIPSVAAGLPYHGRPDKGGAVGMQPVLPDISEASLDVNFVPGSTRANWTATCKAMWAYAAYLPSKGKLSKQFVMPSTQLMYIWRPAQLPLLPPLPASSQLPSRRRQTLSLRHLRPNPPPAPSQPISLGQQLPHLRPPPPRYLSRRPPTPPFLPSPRSHSHVPRSTRFSHLKSRPVSSPPTPAPLLLLSMLILLLSMLILLLQVLLGRLIAVVGRSGCRTSDIKSRTSRRDREEMARGRDREEMARGRDREEMARGRDREEMARGRDRGEMAQPSVWRSSAPSPPTSEPPQLDSQYVIAVLKCCYARWFAPKPYRT